MEKNSNHKFARLFSKINVILSNRKKESSKVYFSKPSLKSIFLSIGSSILIIDFIFRFMRLFNYEKVNITENIYQLSGIAGGILIAVVALIVISKAIVFKYFKLIFSALIIIGILCSYYSTNNYLVCVGSVILGIGYGIVFGFIVNLFLYSFAMSERLIFSLALVVLFFSYSFYFNSFDDDMIKRVITPSALAIFVNILFLFCGDYFIIDNKSEVIPTYSLVLLIAIIFIICLNQAFIGAIQLNTHQTGIQENKSFYSTTYYIGFIISTIVTIFAFLYCKKALIVVIIAYFMAVFGAHQLTIINEVFDNNIKFWKQCADVAYGFSSSLGYIIILMMIAKILDDKSTRFNLFYISFCAICFTFSSVFLRKYLLNIDVRVLAIIMLFVNLIIGLIVSICNFIGFNNSLTNNVVPVTEADTDVVNHNKIDPNEVLTPKEKMVFDFLLEGLTLRQISGELGMKYDSVNFHYKNIYRKLDVNSKIELILKYGDMNK